MEVGTQNVALDKSKTSTNGKENEGKVLLIVFKLGAEEYALPIDQIKEVVLTPRISRIPQTPSYIKGVANIRGNVISIVDLEERFGLVDRHQSQENDSQTEEQGSNYTLVIESEQFRIGVLVKEVPNTLSVKMSEIDQSSDIAMHSSLDEHAINGVVKLDDRMIILIDMLNMMDSGDIKTKEV